MCCSANRHDAKSSTAARKADLTFRVEDMTCSHCAATIKSAIGSSFPGISVEADTVGQLVYVDGITDAAAIAAVIERAGYSPNFFWK